MEIPIDKVGGCCKRSASNLGDCLWKGYKRNEPTPAVKIILGITSCVISGTAMYRWKKINSNFLKALSIGGGAFGAYWVSTASSTISSRWQKDQEERKLEEQREAPYLQLAGVVEKFQPVSERLKSKLPQYYKHMAMVLRVTVNSRYGSCGEYFHLFVDKMTPQEGVIQLENWVKTRWNGDLKGRVDIHCCCVYEGTDDERYYIEEALTTSRPVEGKRVKEEAEELLMRFHALSSFAESDKWLAHMPENAESIVVTIEATGKDSYAHSHKEFEVFFPERGQMAEGMKNGIDKLLQTLSQSKYFGKLSKGDCVISYRIPEEKEWQHLYQEIQFSFDEKGKCTATKMRFSKGPGRKPQLQTD